jgi:hypothetical protein
VFGELEGFNALMAALNSHTEESPVPLGLLSEFPMASMSDYLKK